MSGVREDGWFAEMAAVLPAAGEPRAGDDALAARAVEAAVRRHRAAPAVRLRPRSSALAIAAFAAALMIAATAAAYLGPRLPRPRLLPGRVGVGDSFSGAGHGVSIAVQRASVAAPESAVGADAPGVAAPEVAAARPAPGASSAAALRASAAPRPGTTGPPGAAPPPGVVAAAGEDAPSTVLLPATPERAGDDLSSPANESAAQRFARANTLRRRGDVAGALDAYRQLQASHPASPEAALSHVSVGRALLDGGGAPAAALAAFDAYLTRGGPLAEEALVGRALALGRLARKRDERLAWEALLVRFPLSVSAARARARLEELR